LNSGIIFLTENKISIVVDGIAKFSPNADLYQYLMEDISPSFFFRTMWIRPVAQLYASKKGKKEADVNIECTCSKLKP